MSKMGGEGKREKRQGPLQSFLRYTQIQKK